MFDSGTGKSLNVEKVIDITEDCPQANRKEPAVIFYFRAERGMVAQIRRPNEGKTYGGSFIHFFVDELDREMSIVSPNDTFGSTAKGLGLTKAELRELIEAQAPK